MDIHLSDIIQVASFFIGVLYVIHRMKIQIEVIRVQMRGDVKVISEQIKNVRSDIHNLTEWIKKIDEIQRDHANQITLLQERYHSTDLKPFESNDGED